jgi:hypothetical protein
MRITTHWLTAALMRQVQRLTPVERREWGQAMAAEFSSAPGGSTSLRFALGCLWAAVRLRAQSGYWRIRDEGAAGVLIGILFCTHAAIEGTQAWPLIWPALGGAVAALMAVRNGRPLARFSGAGARTGAAAASIFFVGGLVSLWWMGVPDLQSRATIVGLAAVLAILISAFTAGLAGICIRGRRS